MLNKAHQVISVELPKVDQISTTLDMGNCFFICLVSKCSQIWRQKLNFSFRYSARMQKGSFTNTSSSTWRPLRRRAVHRKPVQLWIPRQGVNHQEAAEELKDQVPLPTLAPATVAPFDHCLLPPDGGRCKEEIPHYFFNATSRKCQIFLYGGCRGNENRFEAQAECLHACQHLALPPQKIGKCPRSLPGNVHSSKTPYCASDGACPGNEKCCPIGNVWKCSLPDKVHRGYCPQPEGDVSVCSEKCSGDNQCAWDEKCCLDGCHRKCVRAVPARPGVCPKTQPLPSFPCENQCLDDRPCRDGQKCCFTGCGLDCIALEPHDSEEDVAQNRTREQSPHGAPSRGKEPHQKRHCHHDRECPEGETCCHNGHCKTECQEEGADLGSLAQFRNRPHICLLPPDAGFHDNTIQSFRFFYDVGTGRCEIFLYRGNGGNANNFASEFACVLRCVDSGVCVLPPNEGVGEYLSPRYFYNFFTRKCQLFWFRGYGGNENNFREQDSCNWRCQFGNVAAASRSSSSVALGARSSGEAKPGRCPVITAGCCILQCIDDSDCPGDEKCCGLTCEKPAF